MKKTGFFIQVIVLAIAIPLLMVLELSRHPQKTAKRKALEYISVQGGKEAR